MKMFEKASQDVKKSLKIFTSFLKDITIISPHLQVIISISDATGF